MVERMQLMADLTTVGTVDKTLVASLADAKSYMVEENPSLVGAYTAINTGSSSSSNNAANQQSTTTTVTYPNLGLTNIGTTLGGIGGWGIDRDNEDMYYHINRYSFKPNLDIDAVCEENGLAFAVEGLYKSILLTSEESEIVKIWENSNNSIEEFFVLGAIHGNIDLDAMIALSEVSLGRLAGKKLSDLYDMEGMSKNFFKIIEYTSYLDDLVLDKRFIRYWLGRRQDLITSHPEAARLVTYMLLLLKTKKSEMTSQL